MPAPDTMSAKTTLILLAVGLVGGSLFYFMSAEDATRTSRLAEPVKIVAFGDSLTAGYGVDPSENYPALLQRALAYKYNVAVLNQGTSGSTSYDATSRITATLEEKPDIVLLGIGGNDALRLIPPEKVKENIELIIKILQGAEKPPRILLLQMQAGIHGGFDYKKKFDTIYPELAQKYGLPLVPFVVTKIYLDEAYMQPDRIHMNAAGYKYIVDEYVKGAVEKELQTIR